MQVNWELSQQWRRELDEKYGDRLPHFSCYRLSVIAMYDPDVPEGDLVYVEGFAKLTDSVRKPFMHSWLELDSEIIDLQNARMPREDVVYMAVNKLTLVELRVAINEQIAQGKISLPFVRLEDMNAEELFE